MRVPLQLKVSCCARSLYEYSMSHMGPQGLNQCIIHDHDGGKEEWICKETSNSTRKKNIYIYNEIKILSR